MYSVCCYFVIPLRFPDSAVVQLLFAATCRSSADRFSSKERSSVRLCPDLHLQRVLCMTRMFASNQMATTLFALVFTGDFDEVHRRLAAGTDINERGHNGQNSAAWNCAALNCTNCRPHAAPGRSASRYQRSQRLRTHSSPLSGRVPQQTTRTTNGDRSHSLPHPSRRRRQLLHGEN